MINPGFAHTNSVLFGAIDEAGTIIVFSIDQHKDSKAIHSAVLLKVEREQKIERSCWHRLSWSPRIGRTFTTGSGLGVNSKDNES